MEAFLNLTSLLCFLLITFRFMGMFNTSQFFTAHNPPVIIRAALPFMLAMLIAPMMISQFHTGISNVWLLALLAVQEFMIGAILGFSTNFLTGAVQFAGHHISMQMGLEITEAVDPSSQMRTPVMGRFMFLTGMLLFLGMGLHRTLISAVCKSFEVLPVGVGLTTKMFQHLSQQFTQMGCELIILSVTIALPVFGTMVVLEIVLAFVSKAMPQMNIFMVSLPLKIFTALFLTQLSLNYFAHSILSSGHALEGLMFKLLPAAVGGH